jgi:hypothetical protein
MHSPYEDEVNLHQVFMQAKNADFLQFRIETVMTIAVPKTFHLVRSVLLCACVALFAAPMQWVRFSTRGRGEGSMRFRACLFGAILAASGATSASADMVISEDRGGQIGQYVHAYTALASAGEHVIIDGPCLSACTLMLGIVSRERICATSRAQLGFHAAWLHDAFGHPITSLMGTQFLLSIYPPDVRSWISRHGGLSRTWIFLKGRELASMVPSCVSRGGVATLPLYTTKSTGRMNEVQKKNAWKNYAEGLSYRKSKFSNLMYSNNDPNAGPQEWTLSVAGRLIRGSVYH